MKTKSILVCVIVLLSTGAAWADLDDGLVAYYSFNDNSNDDSGNGHNLAIPGPWISVQGVCGNAISLEHYGGGTNHGSSPLGPYTSTSGMGYPGPAGFTATFWAFIEEGTFPIVRDYWQHTACGETFQLGVSPGIATDIIHFMVRHDFCAPDPMLQISALPYEGQWTHMAGVFDTNDDSIKLYINGQLIAQDYLLAPMRSNLPPYLYVCGNWHETHQASVDEVRIYNRALSDGEIQTLVALCPLIVDIDIRPGSCFNPLNIYSKGVLPVAILGSEYFDVNDIDLASVRLAGVSSLRSNYRDITGPESNDPNACGCADTCPDGYTDLMLKFRTTELAEALTDIYGQIVRGDELELTLTGELYDGTLIEGLDYITVVGKAPKRLKRPKLERTRR